MIKITIEAPQGWGKGWLAEQIAQGVSHWKGCAVQIVEDGETETKLIGELGTVTCAKIVIRHTEKIILDSL